MLVREKLKKLSNFFSWSCRGESFRTSPKTWSFLRRSEGFETPQKVAPGKPIWWKSINQYSIDIYIYTGSIQNRSKSLRFQNSTPFSPTKDFRNGWTFIYEKTNTAMGLRHDRGWVTVMAPSSAISPKCSNSMKCTIAEIALAVNGW